MFEKAMNEDALRPLVISVVLNTNRRDDTLSCLNSLEKSTYPRLKILLLDNSSEDGSVDAIRKLFPSVQVIQLSENLGYAGNNNIGIQAAIDQGADWIFVLNEDVVLAADCIDFLVKIGMQDPQIGILGPLVYHYDEPDVIQSAGGKLDVFWQSFHIAQNLPDQKQFLQPFPVDWISGCAILVRREVIEQVGMLDHRFFYYWEEVDWCIRAARKGWQIILVPEAKIWHKGVQKNYQPSPAVAYFNTRNRFLLFKNHHAPLWVWLYNWFQVLRTFTSMSIRPKWRSKHAHRDAIWQGMLDAIWKKWGPWHG